MAPTMIGALAEVPVKPTAWSPVHAALTRYPGAAAAKVLPLLENAIEVPTASTAPTAMTPALPAGKANCPSPSLPADATIATPALLA